MADSKTFAEKKAELHTKRQQLADKLAKIEAAEKEQRRKQEAVRHLIVGRIVTAHAMADPDFAHTLSRLLDAAVTRKDERKIIADLLPQDTTGKPVSAEAEASSPVTPDD